MQVQCNGVPDCNSELCTSGVGPIQWELGVLPFPEWRVVWGVREPIHCLRTRGGVATSKLCNNRQKKTEKKQNKKQTKRKKKTDIALSWHAVSCMWQT
jgi:hypothetical protein